MPELRLEHLTQTFGCVSAIAGISCQIPEGALWVILGPSGSGKSCLLKAIAGLESLAQGQVLIEDHPGQSVASSEHRIVRVTALEQLDPYLNVADTLSRGLFPDERVEMVAEALYFSELLTLTTQQLSDGQRQQVALGRAIAAKPQILLLDEPLTNLDPPMREKVGDGLKFLQQKFRITTLYATHSQSDALGIADQIMVLDHGEIQQIASPLEIYEKPANLMVAQFLGHLPMNALQAYIRDRQVWIGQQNLLISPKLFDQLPWEEGQQFVLGIRAEDVIIASHRTRLHPVGEMSQFAQLKVDVLAIKPVGRETIVKCQLPDSSMLFNLYAPPGWQGTPGDRLIVQLDIDRLFFFDILTDKRFTKP